MSSPVISAHGLSKRYRLGQIGMTSLRDELQQFRDRFRKSEDKLSKPSASEFWALTDVSFDVQPGEIVGIIGRNGAGKSTLLKILSRITEPTAGEVTMHGRVGSLLEVGTGFHPELSGRDNIFLNGAILGMSRQEVAAKFDAIVEFAEVQKFIDTPVKRYSSGMYVRLAFAVAAHLEPDILIVDEVLAVGDAQFQRKCISRMQDISRGEGRTILVVSHQLDTILRLCTRAILLEKGRIKATGTPNEITPLYYEGTDAVLSPGIAMDLSRGTRHPGSAKFTSFSYEITSLPALNCPYPGCTIRFTVKVHSSVKQSVGGLALYFHSDNETKLFNFDLQRVISPIPLAAGENTFVVETPPIPMNAMPIKASLWMADLTKNQIIDEVKNFCRLDFIELASGTNTSSKVQDSLFLLPGTKLSLNGAVHPVG
jgi:lipopolysaccharide transport system ATP-binding protein